MPTDIMIVEDDACIAEALVEALTNEGFAVRSAPNGRLALAALAFASVDVILSDVMMPELGGLGLVAILRDNGDSTPVVLMSAGEHILELPPYTQFMRKPFDLDEMLADVRGALADAELH